MLHDKPRLLILAPQIWENKSSMSLSVAAQVCLFFSRPQSTEHNFAQLLTMAQSGQGAVESLAMHSGHTDGPHIHKWVSCSPAKLCRKHKHQSENMTGVDG